MEKKSVSASMLILYLAALFAVVGSCFYAFVFKDKQIKIEKVAILAEEQIATALNLSDMEIGIRPATGKLDQETQIPSTITDEGTSEGYYAAVYVEAKTNYKIVLKNINIESEKDDLLTKEERKNIFISIKDIANTTKNLEKDETEIVLFEDVSTLQKLTFFIWLGQSAGDDLQGAKISFDLAFIKV